MKNGTRMPGTDTGEPSRWSVATHLIRERRLGWAMVAGGVLVAVSGLCGVSLFPCPFKQLTGLPCPGCGMTHATVALLRGDFRAMLSYHPLAPVFLLFWSVVVAGLLWPKEKRALMLERLDRLERRTRWPLWVGIALFIFSLTRWFVWF